jgi:hypothetical protein
MPKLLVCCLYLIIYSGQILFAQTKPIGQWREHLEFGPVKEIVFAGESIIVASKWGIYTVTGEDRIIEKFSKNNGLNDLGIQTIQYNPSSEKLLIAYQNSNLDVLYRNDVINIPYIKKSNISGNKTINRIYMDGSFAYLATGLGVIVVNLNKYEVSATWPMGTNGSSANVTSFTADANFFYAATANGILRISRNNKFPENFAGWEIITTSNGFPTETASNIFFIKNILYAHVGRQLYKQAGGQWIKLYEDDWQWVSCEAGNDRVLITQQKNDYAERRIVEFNPVTETTEIIQNNLWLAIPAQAKQQDQTLYIADLKKGLIIKNGLSVEEIKINSPFGALDGEMLFHNNKLYVGGGSINEAWYYLYKRDGFFVYDNNEWKNYSVETLPWMDTLRDIITLAIDPLDETIYAGSYSGGLGQADGSVIDGGGLIEFKSPTNYKIYKQGSPVEKTIGDNSYRVSGLAFDSERNLWFSNFGGGRNFGVKKADGSWVKFSVPFIIQDNMVGSILIDDYNQKWIQVPQGNGLYCYNHGSSIDNPNDDRWKWLRIGKGNGNLPGNLVQAMVKDKDGFLWIGTDKGIGIIQCPGEVFTANGCEAFQPIVQQGNFAGLLFANEEVKAIAVDGANRKWVGTRNGVWLISPDGEKVIERFTEENSPLLSNEINRIAIDPRSGEVYFSTFKGICSYRGNATEGTEKQEDVFVFPNPVPSGYDGQIGIRGLAANSFVKITELNGRLIHQMQASGGQAVWNGRDYKGNKVATGVYLILVTDPTGIEKTAGKIVFIK